MRGDRKGQYIARLAADLQDMLWEQYGGQMQVSLGWAATPTEARAELERRKRVPACCSVKASGISNG